MGIQHRLTSKSQVTVPKDVRVALGVKPGDNIEFIRDDDGRITIAKGEGPAPETREQRRARIRAALEAATGILDIGMSTDEYMREMRGDWEP
jgi:antitoxin PrlF